MVDTTRLGLYWGQYPTEPSSNQTHSANSPVTSLETIRLNLQDPNFYNGQSLANIANNFSVKDVDVGLINALIKTIMIHLNKPNFFTVQDLHLIRCAFRFILDRNEEFPDAKTFISSLEKILQEFRLYNDQALANITSVLTNANRRNVRSINSTDSHSI